jgi:hypothetical protein
VALGQAGEGGKCRVSWVRGGRECPRVRTAVGALRSPRAGLEGRGAGPGWEESAVLAGEERAGGSRPALALGPRACVSSAGSFWSAPSWPRLALK